MTPLHRRATSRRFIVGFLAMGLILLTLLGARLTQAQDPYPVAAVYSAAGSVVGAPSLNIRTGPHVSYSSVAFLLEGQRVALVGRNAGATWALIELPNGFRGWVSARYLNISVPLVFLPLSSPPVANATALVTGEGLYVFLGPGFVYRPIALTQPGDVLRLLGRDVRADWALVALADGRTGWVPGNGPLLPTVFIQDLPISTPYIDYIPVGLSDYYRVYIGPAYYYQYFDEVVIGQSVAILGRNEDGTWLRVRLPDGREGWVDAAVLSLPLSSSALPPMPEAPATVTPSPTPAPTETPLPTQTATPVPTASATPLPTEGPTDTATTTPPLKPTAQTPPTAVPTDVPPTTAPEPTSVPVPTSDIGVISYLFIYPQPDINSEPIAALRPGQELGLLGRTEDGVWVKVALSSGETGWVLSQVLQADINVALLPIVSP